MTYEIHTIAINKNRKPTDYYEFHYFGKYETLEKAMLKVRLQAKHRTVEYIIVPKDKVEELYKKALAHNAKVDKVKEERWQRMEKAWAKGYKCCDAIGYLNQKIQKKINKRLTNSTPHGIIKIKKGE